MKKIIEWTNKQDEQTRIIAINELEKYYSYRANDYVIPNKHNQVKQERLYNSIITRYEIISSDNLNRFVRRVKFTLSANENISYRTSLTSTIAKLKNTVDIDECKDTIDDINNVFLKVYLRSVIHTTIECLKVKSVAEIDTLKKEKHNTYRKIESIAKSFELY